MIKKLLAGLLILFSLFISVGKVQAKDEVVIEFFHSNTCPHCQKEKKFLKELERKYAELKVNSHEVSQPYNQRLMGEAGERLGIQVGPVPLTIIGDKYWTGYDTDERIGAEIEAEVRARLGESGEGEASDSGKLKLPFVGRVDPASLSLPVLTLLVALLDGFNPCAMWALLFLISLLLGMKDRKRMWLLGMTFIGVSALLYFFILAAWLQVFLWIGLLFWVRLAIGVVALGAGGYSLRSWWRSRPGCEIVDENRQEKVFGRIVKVVKKRQLLLAMIGMAVLAVAVNMVEFVCSAGLPAIYTQVLALNQLSRLKYMAYLIFYVFIFMLDDLVVFVIAMLTLKAIGIESKYGRWSKLIGGVVMLLIGLAMLFKPELLSFS